MPGRLAKLFKNHEEQKQPISTMVSGSIPKWISGSYLRVGPGKFEIGDVTMNHFIDGYAMLSKFDIQNGQVTFDKKYLKSTAYQKASENKQPFFPEFATQGTIAAKRSIFRQLANVFSSSDITDNDSINLYTIEGDIFAASETCHIHQITPSDLGTGEKIDYYKVFGVHMASAHPMKDEAGDWYNVGTSFTTTGAKYNVLKMPKAASGTYKDAMKNASVLATISPSWKTYFSYYHTFGMTQNYIIFVEQPLIMSVTKMTDAKINGKGIRDIMEWNPDQKNRFCIVRKSTGEVLKTKYISKTPFFYFHIVNAFEVEGQIVLDVDAYPSNAVMDKMSIGRLRSGDLDQKDPSRLERFVIPLKELTKETEKADNLVTLDFTSASARKVGDKIELTSEGIGEPGFEGPTTNPTKQSQKYKFIYGSGNMLPGYYANAVSKLDLETGKTQLWRENEFVFPGEPKFIPHPNAQDEDDGVLMTTCCDVRDNGQDFLVFLNAKTMEETGRAVVPTQIPQSLHGIYIPSSELNSNKTTK